MNLQLIFYGFFYSLFIFSFLRKFGAETLNFLASKADFLCLILVLCVFLSRCKVHWRPVLFFVLPYGVALLIGLISIPEIDGFRFSAGQLLAYLKLPLLIFLGLLLASYTNALDHLGKHFFVLILINLAFLCFELTSLNLYQTVFPGTISDSIIQGTNIRRSAAGFFHPGPLGTFSALASIWFYSEIVSKEAKIYSKKGLLLSLILLVMSGQRLEMFAVLVSVLLIHIVLLRNRLALFGCVSFVSALLLFSMSQLSEHGGWDIWLPGVNGQYVDYAQMTARNVLYSGASELASNEFPLGGGLGYYGSSFSLINPNSSYQQLGIDQLWWFEGASYLTDTYWAMVIGECGFLGAFLIFASILYLIGSSASIVRYQVIYNIKVNVKEKKLIVYALAASLFALINSWGAPIYTGAMLPLAMICVPAGIVLAKNKIGFRF